MRFITSPSLPDRPTMAVPTSTFAGAMALPSEPPIDCTAAMVTAETPRAPAVSCWSTPNITFEFVLLPVMKVPSTPMNGENTGKAVCVMSAIVLPRRTVMPVSVITTAIITMVAMPTLVGTHCE